MNKLILLVLLFAIFECCNSEKSKIIDADIFIANLKSAPSANLSKENLPEWLVTKINEIESLHSEDISIVKVLVFKGEWRERIVYFIFDTLNSCMLCEVYYEDGKNVIWSTDDISTNSFCTTSKNWILIYEFGEGLY